jgi:hypothetical protein
MPSSSDPAKHARAVEGFCMYFGRVEKFSELLRDFKNMLPVNVGEFPVTESIAWETRCGEWGISVQVAGAA